MKESILKTLSTMMGMGWALGKLLGADNFFFNDDLLLTSVFSTMSKRIDEEKGEIVCFDFDGTE